MEPVKFYVNIEVRSVEEVFERWGVKNNIRHTKISNDYTLR